MYNNEKPSVATFSIIGVDPKTGEVGVAVQSKFLSVGSVVPWAKAGVGAVATQAYANTSYGPTVLNRLEKGFSPEEVVRSLVSEDDHHFFRQFAVIDCLGNSAAYTGEGCHGWAGHQTGINCSAQGNFLVSKETVETLVTTFEKTEGTLAERIIEALDRGQEVGGDSRGKQSAALFVVQNGAGYGGYNDRKYDLRVDDHPEPIKELKRLYALHHLTFYRPEPKRFLPLIGRTLHIVHLFLRNEEYLFDYATADEVKRALRTFLLEQDWNNRILEDGRLDPNVLRYMSAQVEAIENEKMKKRTV
ncbi:DUF1028 domain-containing protein [Texcoconibacillus texcoconensis]|uniref:Putative Ntn-hydrolase superfamily protein n=1 Tax=Texcoconibacillus texcoconensis TaxID=1095777 RepID=A0A840QPN7_9BACI|nr:DUF1028 domain-containing protein [Texcoconibacillus texcoconensis]MBB5173335.1 putative Ntn-hydrolase superfamily protein [Texcoconibacillus texcoconensis]